MNPPAPKLSAPATVEPAETINSGICSGKLPQSRCRLFVHVRDGYGRHIVM